MASNARFKQMEEDVDHVCRTLRTKLKQLPSLTGERRKLAIREAEKELEEGESTIRQMQSMARQAPAQGWESRISNLQSNLQRLKRELAEEVRFPGSSRDELLAGGVKDDWAVRSLDQRTRILDDHKRLDQTTSRLDNTTRLAHETEEIGIGVLGDLHDQGQSLLRAKDKLHETDDNISRSRRILNAMSRRVITNRLLLMFVALLLMGSIVLVVWLRWFQGKGSPPTVAPTKFPTSAPSFSPTPMPT